jgi:hypothetical protein
MSLLQEHGVAGAGQTVAVQRRIMRLGLGADGGAEVETQLVAPCAAFPTAPGSLAVGEEPSGLSPGSKPVRMGTQAGTPYLTEEALSSRARTGRCAVQR